MSDQSHVHQSSVPGGEGCRYWLGRVEEQDEMPASGTKTSVRLVDGCHDGPEGVVKAAKLMARIFRDTGPWVMVKVEPLPDLDVSVNEQAAQTCAHLVAEFGP